VRVDLHPEARAELRAAALWYEERRERLGDELMAAVATILQRISAAPELFGIWPGVLQTEPAVRKAVVDRFPYLIAFEQHEGFILVLAIAHQKRRPLYWLARSSHGAG
jgi:toxin ParE1/3/4